LSRQIPLRRRACSGREVWVRGFPDARPLEDLPADHQPMTRKFSELPVHCRDVDSLAKHAQPVISSAQILRVKLQETLSVLSPQHRQQSLLPSELLKQQSEEQIADESFARLASTRNG
jgi:hypothetical protein